MHDHLDEYVLYGLGYWILAAHLEELWGRFHWNMSPSFTFWIIMYISCHCTQEIFNLLFAFDCKGITVKHCLESQKRLCGIETVKHHGDFWSSTKYILHYNMSIGLWGQGVECGGFNESGPLSSYVWIFVIQLVWLSRSVNICGLNEGTVSLGAELWGVKSTGHS